MKIKTIEKILAKKFHSYLNSIDDSQVRESVKENTIITGGCIASMLLKEKVNDYDLYFTNIETVFLVAEYYLKKMKLKSDDSSIIQIANVVILENQGDSIWTITEDSNYEVFRYVPNSIEDVQYRVSIHIPSDGVFGENEEAYDSYEIEINQLEELDKKEVEDTDSSLYDVEYLSENAITLSNKIQIITRFYGDAEVVHSNYDFVHVTNYWDSKSWKITTNKRALEAILAKELLYKGSRFPLASIFRMRKFIRREWQINVGQIIKMVYQLNDMDLNDINVLREQLTGVDVAYMHSLLAKLTKMKEEDEDLDIKAYFIDVVESIFD